MSKVINAGKDEKGHQQFGFKVCPYHVAVYDRNDGDSWINPQKININSRIQCHINQNILYIIQKGTFRSLK